MVVAPSHESSISALRVELDEPFPDLNLAVADELWVLATYRGVPVIHVRLPGLGRCAQPQAFLAATVGRAAAPRVAFERIQARLAPRLGTAPPVPRLRVSVVICTHRRPEELARLLAALRELDPQPSEIVVVDNAPGDADARASVTGAGATYVRLDIKGLDRARSVGIDRATGDVVAFTDDDVVPSVGWLRNVDSLFADPLVGCVTGPVLPLELRTVAQRDHERIASLNRGFAPRSEDWTSLDAAFAPELGVGANMLVRREALRRPEAMFPAELDAGTPTESGGDGYALYRLIADGWRVVYDPATYVLHDHRSDPSAFRRAVRGYGIGLGSWTATVLERDRDLRALALGLSPLKTLLLAVAQRSSGRADAVEAAAARGLVAGLMMSPARLWRARRMAVQGARAAEATTASECVAPRLRPQVPAHPRVVDGPPMPTVSAVIFAGSDDHEDSIAQTLDSLRQHVFEAIGARESESAASVLARLHGEIVLFWRPGLEPNDEVISAHLLAHRDATNVIAAGEVRARCADSSLVTRLYARQLSDRARRARSAATPTLLDIGDANVSCRVSLLGGEETAEAEERGAMSLRDALIRACVDGAEMRRVAATAALAVSVTWVEVVDDERRAGGRLARLAATWGDDAPLLRTLAAEGRYTRTDRVLSDPRCQQAAGLLLRLLEFVRARRQWAQAAQAVLASSFRRGVIEAGVSSGEGAGPLEVDLDASDPISVDTLRAQGAALRLRGRPAGFMAPLREKAVASAAQELAAGIEQEAWAPLIRDATRGYEPDPAALPTLTVLMCGDPADYRLEATDGVTVRQLPETPGSEASWDAIDAAIRSAATELVAIPLPERRCSAEWATEVRLALSASAIDVAAGIGLDPRWAPLPIQLLSQLREPRMTADTAAMDYIAVRRSRYMALGGIDPTLRDVGFRAPLCRLVARHLGDGGVLAWTVSPGIAAQGRGNHDGTPLSVYGAVLGAGARAREPYARGLLVVTFAALVGAVASKRSPGGALAAVRDVVRFGRGVVASRLAPAGAGDGDAQA